MDNKISVLHFSHSPHTGVWSVMRELAKAQARSGLYDQVGLGVTAFPDWPDHYRREMEKLDIHKYSFTTPKMFGTASYLYQLIAPPPLDRWIEDLISRSSTKKVIVHFHMAWITGVFLPIKVSPKIRLGTVSTVHGIQANFTNRPIRHFIHRQIGKRVVKHGVTLTSVDAATLPVIKEMIGINPDNISVVFNGVPPTDVRGCPRLKDPSRPFTIGFAGSLNEGKGWKLAKDAVIKLAQKGLKIRLLLAGVPTDKPYLDQVLRDYPNIIEYRGVVNDPRRELLQECDVFTLPSIWEGLPMAIVEAMSVGLPVVATPAGGIPEIVIEGKTGFLVSRTVEALCDRFEYLYNATPEIFEKYRKESLAFFEQELEISRVMAKYNSVYEKAIK